MRNGIDAGFLPQAIEDTFAEPGFLVGEAAGVIATAVSSVA